MALWLLDAITVSLLVLVVICVAGGKVRLVRNQWGQTQHGDTGHTSLTWPFLLVSEFANVDETLPLR